MAYKKKIDNIDIARGVGILLVVFGHCISKEMADSSQPLEIIRNFVYVIHMPLFFFISGWLFEKNAARYKKEPAGRFAMDKCRMLMIPYLIFSAATYFIIFASTIFVPVLGNILLGQGYHYVRFPDWIVEILFYWKHQDGHLWFCYVLFLVLLLNRWLIDCAKKRTLAVLAVLSFAALYFSPYLPELLFKTVKYSFIFLAGRYYYCRPLKETHKGWLYIISAAAMLLYLFLQRKGMRLERLVLLPAAEISSAILLIFVVCKKMQGTRAGAVFKFLGADRMSYAIYLIHMPFITSAMVYVFEKIGIPDILNISVSTVFSVVISVVIFKLLAKSRKIRGLCFGIR